MDSNSKTPNIEEHVVEFIEGLPMPSFADPKVGDDVVVLANDEYSARIMTYGYFIGIVSGMTHVDGINPGELYSRCLSYGKLKNNKCLDASLILEDMIRDYNFAGKDAVKDFRVVFQGDGDLGIKMYYSREAFFNYLASINAPVKKFNQGKK